MRLCVLAGGATQRKPRSSIPRLAKFYIDEHLAQYRVAREDARKNLASQMKVGLKALDPTFEFDETVILTRLHAALVAANKAAREAEAAREAAADAEQVD